MRVKGAALDPEDAYQSDWIGNSSGRDNVKMGSDGKPVIGIYGRAGLDLECLGLVQLK